MEESKEEFENSVGEPEKVVSYTLIKIMFKKKMEYHRLIHMKIQGSSKLPTLITLYHHMNHVMNYTLYLQMPLRRWCRDHLTPTPPQQKTFSLPLKFNT